MGKRGIGANKSRKKATQYAAEGPRPQPIPGMSRYARTVWQRVVDSHGADHFKPGSLEQLRAYCEACSSHKKAIGEIQKDGEITRQGNGVQKRSPWALERDACAASMASLATKLSLNVNSKYQEGQAPPLPSKRGDLLFGGRRKAEQNDAPKLPTRLERGLLYGGEK